MIFRFLTMQLVLLVVGCIAAAAAVRKAQSEVRGFYPRQSDRFGRRSGLSPLRLGNLYQLDADSEESEAKVVSKRGLSMLTRMKSLQFPTQNRRVPPRTDNANGAGPMESVRPRGQPLRWGRKR